MNINQIETRCKEGRRFFNLSFTFFEFFKDKKVKSGEKNLLLQIFSCKKSVKIDGVKNSLVYKNYVDSLRCMTFFKNNTPVFKNIFYSKSHVHFELTEAVKNEISNPMQYTRICVGDFLKIQGNNAKILFIELLKWQDRGEYFTSTATLRSIFKLSVKSYPNGHVISKFIQPLINQIVKSTPYKCFLIKKEKKERGVKITITFASSKKLEKIPKLKKPVKNYSKAESKIYSLCVEKYGVHEYWARSGIEILGFKDLGVRIYNIQNRPGYKPPIIDIKDYLTVCIKNAINFEAEIKRHNCA